MQALDFAEAPQTTRDDVRRMLILDANAAAVVDERNEIRFFKARQDLSNPGCRRDRAPLSIWKRGRVKK